MLSNKILPAGMEEKMISNGALLKMLEEAFKNGWHCAELIECCSIGNSQHKEEAWQVFKDKVLIEALMQLSEAKSNDS